MENKIQKISIFLLIVLFLFGIGFSIYIFIQKPKESTQIDSSSSEIFPTAIPTNELSSSDDYFDYVWYEDDYVKFEYPRGWEVDVMFGTNKQVDKSQYNHIKISNGSNWLTIKEVISWDGDCHIQYDISKPLEIISVCGEDRIFTIDKPPYIYYIDSLILMIFEAGSLTNYDGSVRDESLVHLGSISNDGVYKFFGSSLIDKSLYNFSDAREKFIVVHADCDINKEDDAHQCYEFINRFFKSVEKKEQSRSALSSINLESNRTTVSENYQLNGECDGLISLLEDNGLLYRDEKGLFSRNSEEVFECWLSKKNEPSKKLRTIKRFVTTNHRFDLDKGGIGLTQQWEGFDLWGKVMLGKETEEGIYLIEDHFDLGDTATLSLYKYNAKEGSLVFLDDYQFSTYWLMDAYDNEYNLIARDKYIDTMCHVNGLGYEYGSTEDECKNWIGMQHDKASEYYRILADYLEKET